MSYVCKNWKDKFRKKIISGEEAVKKIRSGMGIAIMGPPESHAITDPLTQRQDIEGVRLYHSGFVRPDSLLAHPEKFVNRLKIYGLFLNYITGPLVEKGLSEFIPNHNSMVNGLFTDGHTDIDATFVTLTPPNSNGFMSLSYWPML